MKKVFLNSVIALISVTATAEEAMITCSVSNQSVQVIDNAIVVVGEKLNVPVETLSLELPGPSRPPIRLDGKEIRASYFAGSEFEKQTFLQMSIEGITSTTYDVKPSLYSLSSQGLRFQCLVTADKLEHL